MPAGMMKGGMMKDVFDGGGSPPPSEDEYADEGGGSEYSEEYQEAYADYEAAPSMETFWRAVEACVAESDKKKGGGGLAILLGKAKGKK